MGVLRCGYLGIQQALGESFSYQIIYKCSLNIMLL